MRARDLILSPHLSQQQVVAYLEKRGFLDPQRADDHLQEISRRVGVPERLAELADLLLDEIEESVDPDAALRNLESFIEAVPSPLNLLSLIGSDPNSLKVLVGLLASSPFLTQCLIRNPEYLYWLIEGKRLDRVCDLSYFRKQAADQTRPFPRSEKSLDALRRLRRRELLRIGSQDLLGRTTVGETVQQLSDLAQALLQRAFEILGAEKLPTLDGFAVLALGKLGGRELNFSSDVDLLFIFSRDEESDQTRRFARDYARSLAAFSPEGHLYRVDLRLRPMGKGGEIAYSEKACRQYYRTWADTTDRLALIKCRHVAGDSNLGNRFIASVQDFIFKKYLDQAAVEEVRWIKRRTDEALRRSRETHTHVKLGLGGIREIEFFAQSFQILYGGVHPELRTPNTLSALQRLVDNGFITSDEYDTLCAGYVFLRDLEHKLQLVHDLQTHTLPRDSAELLRCARRMGYRAGEQETDKQLLKRFNTDLRTHNKGVREIFRGLFEEAETARGMEEIILNPAMKKEEAVERLKLHQVRSPEEILDGIRMLSDAPAFPHSPSRIRNLLANLVPYLIEYSHRAPSQRDLFSRFDRFCDSLGNRANLYTEVIENQDLRERLFKLLASGEFMAETLIQNPELLDAVAYPKPADYYLPELDALLSHKQDAEKPDVVRIFKRREEFKVALNELMAPGSPSTRKLLTELAEASLDTVCRECIKRDPDLESARFSLLALGKLGGRELIFHSDLDLVLVYEDSASAKEIEAVSSLLRDFRSWLQALTEAGRAYRIDFRLRPEGRHTAEAVPLRQFIRYYQERAAPWERLAYVKARHVYGHGVTVPLHDLVYHSAFDDSEIAGLAKIRLRKEREIGKEEKSESFDLKVGRGGLLDVQFIVQLLQVKYDIDEVNLLKALYKLKQLSRLGEHEAAALEEGVHLLYSVESIDDLIDVSVKGKLSKDPSKNEYLAKWLGYQSGVELTEHYRSATSGIRKVYESYFG